MPITHRFVSPKADGADATLVRPSNWNDTHQGEGFIVSATDPGAVGYGAIWVDTVNDFQWTRNFNNDGWLPRTSIVHSAVANDFAQYTVNASTPGTGQALMQSVADTAGSGDATAGNYALASGSGNASAELFSEATTGQADAFIQSTRGATVASLRARVTTGGLAQILVVGLPGSNPNVADQVWNDRGIVKVGSAAAGVYAGPAGPAGMDGEDGEPGPPGPQGNAGPAGAAGAAGAVGPAGPPGLDGVDGEDGALGPAGATGPQGATGSQGIQGIQGQAGSQGPPGLDGEDGTDGLPGATGPQGVQGATGSTGPQGLQGVPGSPGADGEDGLDGAPGPMGATGLQGVQGIQGIAGATGAAGPPGLDGIDGEDGAVGPVGPVGPAGSGGGGLTLTSVEVDFGTAPRFSGSFDLTGLSGLTVGKQVLMAQAAGPYTGKGNREDEAEMDLVTATAYVLSTSSIRAYWTAHPFSGPMLGNVKFGYAVSA